MFDACTSTLGVNENDWRNDSTDAGVEDYIDVIHDYLIHDQN